MSSELELIIRKHVLKNAFDYGKANPGSVVGKVIGEAPDSKADMKKTMATIISEATRVAKLSKSEIEKEMTQFTYVEKKEEKKTLELPNAIEGKVVTRFPPEPSGYPHIGHAKAAWLDYEAARVYGGKMILRFDDTNPEKESYQFVEAIKEGLTWLGIPFEKETFTSDNMPKIYETAVELMKKERAYVCTCSQETISKNREDGTECHCRNISIQANLEAWEKMIEGVSKEGEAILRFKGDLKALNTVMRDPALARIIDTKHYRQLAKYRVWPGYDLAVVVMDHLEGITHSMRSKEYELRDELYSELFAILGWKRPEMIGFSRLAIKNAPISKRLLLPLVKEGKVLGWDDPRLPTIKGLERRGLLPKAVKEFVQSFGLSKVESEPDWEALLTLNRKMLDPESKHFFFVPNPIEVEIDGATDKELELKLHPKKEIGVRKIKVGNKAFVSQEDAKTIQIGEIFRLKDFCNVKLVERKDGRLITQIMPEGKVDKKLQWVGHEREKCEVLKPKDLFNESGEFDPNSLEKIEGIVELAAKEINMGEIVQFERFGFCRLDKKNTAGLRFVFSC
ncbi:glutamate--tRNA ligase [Candidatus Micrarchaeota archaeon]|nr:glutamate--tRNA ligase [Candidatus Micrarchaeota archaeon]